MEENEIFTHGRYLFVFAHPDDDMYVGMLLKKLADLGKDTRLIFLTSGDQGGGSGVSNRKDDVIKALTEFKISQESLFFLDIPEKELLNDVAEIIRDTKEICEAFEPDCVIGMDYEGGHEGHDVASFVASKMVEVLDCEHYVFPVYHSENGRRIGAAKVPGRQGYFEIEIPYDEIDVVKIRRFECYRSEIGHFLGLEKQSPGYFQRMFTRELFRKVVTPIDYSKRPWKEVGYEKHRNGFKYEDFITAISKVK